MTEDRAVTKGRYPMENNPDLQSESSVLPSVLGVQSRPTECYRELCANLAITDHYNPPRNQILQSDLPQLSYISASIITMHT